MLNGRFGGLLPRSYSRLLSKEEAVLARFDDREPFDLRMAPRRPLAFYFDVLKVGACCGLVCFPSLQSRGRVVGPGPSSQ